MPPRRKKLPPDCVLEIESLSHDGRGVARDGSGKTVFVDLALPGERVEVRFIGRRKQFDEARTTRVLDASPDRVTPVCPHFELCGGCSLQHLSNEAQLRAKQAQLEQTLLRLGKVAPRYWLSPVSGPTTGYRRKARLGVRYVRAKERVLVGFRERRHRYLADISSCAVLHPIVGERLQELATLIEQSSVRESIAQIEVAVSDTGTVLVFRNLEPVAETDLQRFREFEQQHGVAIYLQPGGPETVAPIASPQVLRYGLPEFSVDIEFRPLDFFQVNTHINQKLVSAAIEALEVDNRSRVLDLFCGLGNFSLPLARKAASVVGVEGDAAMVARATENAQANDIDNATFYRANLFEPIVDLPWTRASYDRVLLDPPRSGASEILSWLGQLRTPRIVYVSCHPATLARDIGVLVNEHGYTLETAGVFDMFPNTSHVESMAVLVL